MYKENTMRYPCIQDYYYYKWEETWTFKERKMYTVFMPVSWHMDVRSTVWQSSS